MYINPMAGVVTSGGKLSRDQEREIQDKFEDFYQDVFEEAAKFGEIDDLIVLDNLGDHLIGERNLGLAALREPLYVRASFAGNVYVKYFQEEDAMKALQAINGRWYSGRQVQAEYSIVTEFAEARCRQVRLERRPLLS
jgi:splicing factor U2AF 35 kDa subunit